MTVSLESYVVDTDCTLPKSKDPSPGAVMSTLNLSPLSGSQNGYATACFMVSVVGRSISIGKLPFVYCGASFSNANRW